MAKTKHTDIIKIKTIAHAKKFIYSPSCCSKLFWVTKARHFLIILFNLLKVNEGHQGTNDKKKNTIKLNIIKHMTYIIYY